MKAFLAFIASVLISFSAFAAKENNEKKVKDVEVTTVAKSIPSLEVRGSIFDKNNKETLAGATVLVNGKKYYSDLDGNFTLIGLQPGKHTIRVELISYEPTQLDVNVSTSQKLNISLSQQ